MTTDEKILNELYKYAEDILADSHTASGDYYASDLAKYTMGMRRVEKYTGKYENELKMIEHKKNYNTLYVCDEGHLIDGEIKINVDNFSCTFPAKDIFTYIVWWEKLCGVIGRKRKMFHVPNEEELAA